MSRLDSVAGLACCLGAVGVVVLPDSAASDSSGGVGCEIKATPFSGGVRLQGFARAKSSISGSYKLTVRKIGAGGDSTNVQSGGFSVGPGDDGALSEIGLGLERGATYEAVLTLEWADGATKCEKRSGSRA